jgi:hypothetical protein
VLGEEGASTPRLATEKVVGLAFTQELRPQPPRPRGDAGVQLRDAQILARDADPRKPSTEHYDRARGNVDCHGVHFLTAYVAGV